MPESLPSRAAAAVLVLALASGCFAGQAQAQLEPGEPADNFELGELMAGSGATDVAFLSDGRAVVTFKTGEIAVLHPDGRPQQSRAATIEVDSASEKGLLGVVRDDRDRLYLYASTGGDNRDKHKVFTATVSAGGEVSVDLSRSILGSGLEGPANHDGGGMIIHEGQLYVGVGDTGRNASPPVNRYGICLNKPNAKILRVHLDGSIPRDNPLVGLERVTGCEQPTGELGMYPPDERIYAWGLRNPWRFWIDPETDLLWIGDVGEVREEEITVGGKGANHGWPFREGNVVHGAIGGLEDCMDVTPATPCVAPQHGYPRSDGVSVTGGLIPPRGCGWGAFEQRYFFADYRTGRVWTLDVTADRRGVVAGSRRMFARIDGVVSFRMGPDGAMYAVSYGGGGIQRIAPRQVPATCGRDPGAPGAPARDSGAPADAGGAAAAEDDGCGCRLVRSRNPGAGWLAGGLGLLLLAGRATARRSRSRGRP